MPPPVTGTPMTKWHRTGNLVGRFDSMTYLSCFRIRFIPAYPMAFYCLCMHVSYWLMG